MINFRAGFGRVAKKLLQKEYFIWLTSVDARGTPQPRPVWFIWEDDTLLIYSEANAHKLKHIRNNPHVSLHFNSADTKGEERIVVFAGKARIDRSAQPPHKNRLYMKKYKAGIIGMNATPEQFGGRYSIAIRITPAKLRGWE